MQDNNITPDMTVLDIISKHRGTEEVFKRHDQEAGECICCNALFDSLENMAHRYGLDLHNLLAEIEKTIFF